MVKVTETNAEWERILNKIAGMENEKTMLPVDICYAIIKNKIAIEQSLQAYYITRDEIINKHSNGSGQITEKDDPESFRAVCADISLIAKKKADVDISTITLSRLETVGKLPINVMSALGFMIIE